MVTEVKGIRGGRERVANELEQALAYGLDGSVRSGGRKGTLEDRCRFFDLLDVRGKLALEDREEVV